MCVWSAIKLPSVRAVISGLAGSIPAHRESFGRQSLRSLCSRWGQVEDLPGKTMPRRRASQRLHAWLRAWQPWCRLTQWAFLHAPQIRVLASNPRLNLNRIANLEDWLQHRNSQERASIWKVFVKRLNRGKSINRVGFWTEGGFRNPTLF